MTAGTAAGAAIAGPVNGNGVIYGCYTKATNTGSHTLTLQDVGTSCPKGTTGIQWNEKGQQGPPGTNGTDGSSVVTSSSAPTGSCTTGDTDVDLANGEVYTCTASAWADTGSSLQGPQGAPGKDGSPGTGAIVATEPPGANCANGGAAITDGSNHTTYACNGAPANQPVTATDNTLGTVLTNQGTAQGNYQALSGPKVQVTSGGTYFVQADIQLQANTPSGSGPGFALCSLTVNGTPQSDGTLTSVDPNAEPFATGPISDLVTVGGGTTIGIACQANASIIAGAGGSSITAIQAG